MRVNFQSTINLFFNIFIVDMVSYLLNVDMIFENFQSSGNPATLKSLVTRTFKGRRFEITTGVMPGRDDRLKKRCPVLNHPSYDDRLKKRCPVLNHPSYVSVML